MPSGIERQLALAFQIALVLLVGLAAWQCRHGWPVSSNLLELIPAHRTDALQARAQQRVEEPLNREVVALVGVSPEALPGMRPVVRQEGQRDAADPADPAGTPAARQKEAQAQAVALARQTGAAWRASGLFETVQVDVAVDLSRLRQQLLEQRLALLPAQAAATLAHAPLAFAQARAAEIGDPFAAAGAAPLADDWLGLAHRAELAQVPPGDVHLDLATGTLQAEHNGKTWVLLHARTHGDAFDDSTPARVAAVVDQARQRIGAAHGELLVAGGALFAAAGRAQAVKESAWIGGAATLGIIVLILAAVRRPRGLLALLPAGFGLFCGALACVTIFGKIHVITLVVGASLMGVACDFPMQWLGKSYGMPDWRAWPAMRKVLPGLSISLAAGLIGYLALAFTPFPALTQIAVFSAAGLLGAYACTVCQLPALLRGWTPRPSTRLARCADALLRWRARAASAPALRWAIGLACALVLGGIWRLHLQDDLRQWISAPPALLQQARRIGQITGFVPTSQFFLVRAPDEATLLTRQAELGKRLQVLVAAHRLSSFSALSQLVAPPAEQRARRASVEALAHQPAILAVYERLGIPAQSLLAEIATIHRLPLVTVEAALAGPLGERWKSLWLGRQPDGEYAGTVTLLGLADAGALEHVAKGIPGTSLVDRTGELNRTFAATRIEAAELKATSYVIAALLLWFAFGRRAMLRILAVPLAATACSLAALGYLGQPLTFFSLFGLLLVSAIATDYAIFMHERVAGASASLVGIMLAGATTLLSFGLLAVSGTPAIANFGLSVALGVAFSLLFAPWVRPLDQLEIQWNKDK